MIDRNQPWSLIGVSQEARDAARHAAEEAGVPVGEWLSETIRRIRAEDLERGEPPEDAAVDAARQAAIEPAESTATTYAEPAAHAEHDPADRIDTLVDAIERLTARLESLDARLARLEGSASSGG